MKHIRLLAVVLLLVLFSCSGRDSRKENFIETYKEILIVWGTYPDSVTAVPKVRAALKKHGYTEESFKRAYFDFARQPQEFMAMLDSARARADRQINSEKGKFRRE